MDGLRLLERGELLQGERFLQKLRKAVNWSSSRPAIMYEGEVWCLMKLMELFADERETHCSRKAGRDLRLTLGWNETVCVRRGRVVMS